ncbi:MAG: hypothetical protein WC564_04150 [Patescibacteria group bacterium]
MVNSINVLKAKTITPEVIKSGSFPPLSILGILISGDDYSPAKLKALMDRPDVTGYLAHQLLRESSDKSDHANFFNPLLKLYIQKFIKEGPRETSLRYAIMTTQLWIHFISSSDEYKDKEVVPLLEQIKPVLVECIKHWTAFSNSAIELLDEIEKLFCKSYNNESTFPGDKAPPFHFSHDDFAAREVKRYVLPFVGEVLVELSQTGKYYQKPEDLHALATRGHFAQPDLAGPLYIKSTEKTFSLDDIGLLISLAGDAMERFLLSDDGFVANNNFCYLCRRGSPKEVFSLLKCLTHYAGFNFSENEAYQRMSLEEKADFWEPYSYALESNYMNKQYNLLRLWMNDPEWRDSKKSVADLTKLALQKRKIFSFNADRLFLEMITIILRRVHRKEIQWARDTYKDFMTHLLKGEIEIQNHIENLNTPALFLAALEKIESRYDLLELDGYYTDYLYKYNLPTRRVLSFFQAHLITCLPSYTNSEACEAVRSARFCNDQLVMNSVVERDLSSRETLALFKEIDSENINMPFVEKLRSKLFSWLQQTEGDEDCLRLAVYLMIDCGRHLNPHLFIEYALKRKSFSNLSFLLTTLQKIIENGVATFEEFTSRHASEAHIEILRVQIEDRMDVHHNTREDALLFCQNKLLDGGVKSWRWFYSKYPLDSISDINSLGLNEEELRDLFRRSGAPHESLLAVWKKTSFKKIPMSFTINYILIGHNLSEHPDWAGFSLKERLSFFTIDNRGSHEAMLRSLTPDFESLWRKEKWTINQYLEEIERINPYSTDDFASLALKLI